MEPFHEPSEGIEASARLRLGLIPPGPCLRRMNAATSCDLLERLAPRNASRATFHLNPALNPRDVEPGDSYVNRKTPTTTARTRTTGMSVSLRLAAAERAEPREALTLRPLLPVLHVPARPVTQILQVLSWIPESPIPSLAAPGAGVGSTGSTINRPRPRMTKYPPRRIWSLPC